MLADIFSPEQLTILTQIILIDLVLAGDNAIIIGMVASKFPIEQKKKNYFLGYWWSCSIKNYLNFNDCLLVANHWFKIARWIIITLYCF